MVIDLGRVAGEASGTGWKDMLCWRVPTRRNPEFRRWEEGSLRLKFSRLPLKASHGCRLLYDELWVREGLRKWLSTVS